MDRRSEVAARVLAVLVWGAAVLNVGSALFAHTRGRLEVLRDYLPMAAIHGSRLLAVVAGFLLVFLGYGLWRQKRRAWEISVLLLAASSVAHMTKGLDWEEAAGSAVLLAVLVGLRGLFRAGSDPVTLRRGVAVLAISLLFACLYGTVGFFFLDREFHAAFGLRNAVAQTLRLFFTFGGAPVPHTHHAEWFLGSVYVMGAVSLVYGVAATLRPVVYRTAVWPEERARASEIAARHGRSSLARMTLFPDKTLFFPQGLDAYLAFRVVGNAAVVLGDPIGPSEQIAAAISAFGAHCAEMDWTPCYYQVPGDYLEAYRGAGYQVVKIGEEALIELATFDLKGGAWKDLRNNTHKLARQGIEVRFYRPPISEELLHDLREVSDEWLRQMHGGEKHFSLGWFDPEYLRECEMEVVTSPQGRVEAFANFYTEYQEPVISPDLMRRRADAPKGVMDLLFVRAAEHYREQGYQGLNLGLAPLSGVGEEAGAGVAERVMRLMYERLNRFYAFKGLRAFKEKFHPRWEPRYLVYASAASLPKAAMAVVRANNPGLLWL